MTVPDFQKWAPVPVIELEAKLEVCVSVAWVSRNCGFQCRNPNDQDAAGYEFLLLVEKSLEDVGCAVSHPAGRRRSYAAWRATPYKWRACIVATFAHIATNEQNLVWSIIDQARTTSCEKWDAAE